MLGELPGMYNNELVLQALKVTGREFCRKTEVFREELEPLPVVDYQQDYTLSFPYDASIHRIHAVRINGAYQASANYELIEETTLRFASGAVPQGIDDRCLVCAAAGTTTVATWAAITDGSVTFTVDSDTHSLASLDFSSCSDLDDVATVIQTALRVEMDSNTGLFRWYPDQVAETTGNFVLYVDSGTVSYLTAGASGTDISGSGYLNGLTGTATLDGLIQCRVSFRPDMTADDFPDWFMDRWGEVICAGALEKLSKQRNEAWTDAGKAKECGIEYRRGLNQAKAEVHREMKGGVSGLRG